MSRPLVVDSLGAGHRTNIDDMIYKKQRLSDPKPWAVSNEAPMVTVYELSHLTTSSFTRAKRNAMEARITLKTPGAEHTGLSKIPRNIPEQCQKPPNSREAKGPLRCPVAKEFQRAQEHCPVLASTGCTKELCQAGRAVHSDEPRIGENRSLENVETEAEGFLRELYRENFFDSHEAFDQRLKDVLAEIRNGALEGSIRGCKERGRIGGNWRQTREELTYGIRRAWRNARKCIMRSHSDELQ